MSDWYGFSDKYTHLSDGEICALMTEREGQSLRWLEPKILYNHLHQRGDNEMLDFYWVSQITPTQVNAVFYKKIHSENMSYEQRLATYLANNGIPAKAKTYERALCEAWLLFTDQLPAYAFETKV